MSTKQQAIGIDVGSVSSCVAVNDRTLFKAVSDDDKLTTASYIAFTENGDCRIGEEAKGHLKLKNSANVVFNLKQLIGRQFSDSYVQRNINQWPFDLIKDEEGKVYIQTQLQNELTKYTPEEVLSMLLSKLKRLVKKKTEDVSNAVIAIPSFFNNHQRQAMVNCATSVGFNNVRLISNSTAIALAYYDRLLKNCEFIKPQTVIIFDLGATSLDVSVVFIDRDNVQVKSTTGTCELGGNDFDERIIEYFVNKFKKQYNCDLRSNRIALRRLRVYCEQAKIRLSSTLTANININDLLPGINFNETLSRETFETICGDLFHFITVFVQKALFEAKVEKENISEIIRAGYSSLIPKLEEMLSQMFDHKKLNKSLNCGECVAIGAAIQSSMLSKTYSMKPKVVNIIPYSFGVATKGGIMNRVVNRYSKIPCKKSKIFTTDVDNQTQLKVRVYEGEAVNTRHNKLFGVFTFDGINAAAKGEPQLELIFDVDANGILSVFGSEKLRTKRSQSVMNDSVDRLNATVSRFEFEDEQRELRSEAKNKLENAMSKANRLQSRLSNDDKQQLVDLMEEIQHRLNSDQLVYKQELDLERERIETLMANHAIGIDLGTTFSCVAVCKKGRVEVFENDSGSRTTPSYVAFTEHERIIGNEAKNHVSEDPTNTVFEAKRLIGRKFNDREVQGDMIEWPFTVFDDNGDPKIEVTHMGIHLLDVTPLSYGTDVVGDMMDVLIPRNTSYPVTVTEAYLNGYDNQTEMLIQVLQGEYEFAKDATKLKEFQLTIPPMPRAKCTVNVCFDIDEHGILNVSATELSTGAAKKVMIQNIKGQYTEEQINQMIEAANRQRRRDLQNKARIVAKNSLESFCFDLRRSLNGVNAYPNANQQQKTLVRNKAEETLFWVAANPAATQEQIEAKTREIRAHKDSLTN
ncbi:heat shock protein ssa2-like protein [Leptotrombidium deliense]|uniref:Heat shock protein ssa2-like protein n=1 Tax=Leptotrombidium deliense TaxID=299467 RepID=A0A443SE29_9ACAR|nr:heat shock protein ssa2-like protein [Leptotrombidium deliense]